VERINLTGSTTYQLPTVQVPSIIIMIFGQQATLETEESHRSTSKHIMERSHLTLQPGDVVFLAAELQVAVFSHNDLVLYRAHINLAENVE
jgi:hypothetical protein